MYVVDISTSRRSIQHNGYQVVVTMQVNITIVLVTQYVVSKPWDYVHGNHYVQQKNLQQNIPPPLTINYEARE